MNFIMWSKMLGKWSQMGQELSNYRINWLMLENNSLNGIEGYLEECKRKLGSNTSYFRTCTIHTLEDVRKEKRT